MTAQRSVLRTGFGVVIALLIVCIGAAYRVQETFSQRTVEIHRRYVQQQAIHTNLRRILWSGGIVARDFFLNTAADRGETYLQQVHRLKAESELFFEALAKIRTPDNMFRALHGKFDDLWAILEESADSALDNSQEYSFVQEEIVPRRDAAAALLRELERSNENSMTESEDQFAATRIAAAQRLVLMLGAVLFAGIFVTVLSLRYSENLERQAARQFQEVCQAKSELERLSARLMEIQEEERTRLSRELHDEVIQTLAVLRIEITQAQQISSSRLPEIRENLARARSLAERTVKTCRNISLLLRPSLLDDLGLGPALQWLTEDFGRRTDVRCEFEEQGLQGNLPDAVKTCVFRVTQEALHNCEKHAQARSVTVSVHHASGQLTLQVTDDGVGFEMNETKLSAVAEHFGIIGMRERAAGLGGSLQVDTAPGKGLKIMLSLPVVQPVERAVQTTRVADAEILT